MKYLGIDYGLKRIGIAVSDDTGSLAFPLTTLQASTSSVEEIISLATENHAQTIVLGESYNFQGQQNPIMEQIKKVGDNLEAKGYVVAYEREFMTSAQARREGETAKANLDAAAAALILQSYLDRQKARTSIE